MSKRILVVDDEQSMRDTLQIMLEKEGFEVETADDGLKAIEIFDRKKFDLVITDLKMPGLDGIGMIEALSERSETPVIIMTAYATKDEAIAALNLGASFFIEKPFKKQELMNYVNRTIKMDEIFRENKALKATMEKTPALDLMIGTSKEIVAVKELIRKVACTESTVMITGESGTGKEMAARALHENSPRAKGPFIAINCGAIPSELLESELFGHVRGSFTGAVKDKVGLMEMADGGTFFLDEVGNTIPSIQVKILRAIQEKEVMPVGGHTPRKVDIRLIAATNENLEEAIARQSFRKDLYYRLNVINIHIPPLRERGEDIEILFLHFLSVKDKSGKILLGGIESQIIEILKNYAWPGNIRELENVVERMVALSTAGKICIDHLPDHIWNPQPKQLVSDGNTLTPTMDEIEKAYIHWILTQQNGQKQKAAEILGIGRSTLDRKIEKYGL
ncbi:MAG: sigma-54 dependent transcriptional regulator [Candidatus Latescibacter sp.]|nr:sigma-54 dependent transcriptional regulator [Candidatus Latescibacter sp.]